MKQEKDNSWISILWLGVVLYFCGCFVLKLFVWFGEGGMTWFLIGCVAVGLIYKGLMLWLDKKLTTLFDYSPKPEVTSPKTEPLPFFVKGQVRRRKLDLSRSSNVVADSAGTKRKRQLHGIFRMKRKKRR